MMGDWDREDVERPYDDIYRSWEDAWTRRGDAERCVDQITGNMYGPRFAPAPVLPPCTPEHKQAVIAAFLDVYDRDGMPERAGELAWRQPWNPEHHEMNEYASRLADPRRNIFWDDLTSEQQSRLLVIAALA